MLKSIKNLLDDDKASNEPVTRHIADELSKFLNKNVQVKPGTKTLLHPHELMIDDEIEPKTMGEYTEHELDKTS